MNANFYNRSFLSLFDFTATEIHYLLDLAAQLKKKRNEGIAGNLLKGKNVALLFEKASTRTRCAFEISIVEEGGYPSYIDILNSQFGKKESVEDSARILASYYHGIEMRGYSQETVQKLAQYANVPVYNGLTNEDHPTQILADLLTIREHIPHKPLSNLKIVYVGDTRNNMTNAWIYGCAKLGVHFVAYGPKELRPDSVLLDKVAKCGKQSGARIEVSDDIDCLKDADVIYTDVWVSMGEEDKLASRAKLLKNYKITMDMLNRTNNPQVLFMHCLPAFHNFETSFAKDALDKFGVDIREVDDEVFRSKHSVVFNQAKNRLHTIKAVLVATLNKELNLTAN